MPIRQPPGNIRTLTNKKGGLLGFSITGRMLLEVIMSHGVKQNMDELAVRIRRGIAKQGEHVLNGDQLKTLWENNAELSNEEKELLLRNFAEHYGFTLHFSSSLLMAAFQFAESPIKQLSGEN